MSAVNRERRKNAGKRMAILGKKLEEDDAFWSHETWADEDDSGNESFHESDEDSALQKDIFDSDFNDSESDNEEEDVAAGEAEERELRKSERSERRQKNYKNMVADFPISGGQKRRRGFPGGSKRVIGEGFNAGIVLNLPLECFDSLSYVSSIAAERSVSRELTETQQYLPKQSTVIETGTASPHCNTTILARPEPSPALPATMTSTAPKRSKTSATLPRKSTRASRVSVRERRSAQVVRQASSRSGESSNKLALSRKASSKTSSNTVSRVSIPMKRKRYAQEELLLEAIHETEPENQRWLHGRKRVQDQYNRDKDLNAGGSRDKYRGKKIVQKFHSRRGCLITLTFPEMDSVPEILMRRKQSINQQPQALWDKSARKSSFSSNTPSQEQYSSRCVITGKIGKYKDPLTNYAYHDPTAFKELRRRHKEGEAIVNMNCASSTMECNDANFGNVRNEPSTSEENTSFKKTKLSQREKDKPSANNTDESVKDKPPGTRMNESLKKLSPPSVDFHQKLPFQSPKPYPKLNINGNNSASISTGGSKVHQSHRDLNELNLQKKDSVEKLALAWERKANTSMNVSDVDSTKITDSPIPLSGRRLSPRKWKPSEKVLETMSMLPDKGNGGNAVVPRVLGIQHLSVSSFPSHLNFDNNFSTSTVESTPTAAGPIALSDSNTSVVPKPLLTDKSLLNTKDNSSRIIAKPYTNLCNDIREGLSTTAALRTTTVEVGKYQESIKEMPLSVGASINESRGTTQGHVVTKDDSAEVPSKSHFDGSAESSASMNKEYKQTSDITTAGLVESNVRCNFTIEEPGDKRRNDTTTRQAEGQQKSSIQ